MERWTAEHRAYIAELYFKTGESVVRTQHAFRTQFQIPCLGRIPNNKTIKLWIASFRTTASVLKHKPGRPRSVRTPENIAIVREARRHATALQLSNRSLRRILQKDLNFHLYKMVMFHELEDCDTGNRLRFSEQFLEILSHDTLLLICVNKQNFWYWAEENPKEIFMQLLHRECDTV
ncbi:hypothetical protein C0J52_07880 [Blattella germanica]|nr:hypothetical protein C0J52_07880 [Blattella germanica]